MVLFPSRPCILLRLSHGSQGLFLLGRGGSKAIRRDRVRGTAWGGIAIVVATPRLPCEEHRPSVEDGRSGSLWSGIDRLSPRGIDANTDSGLGNVELTIV